MPQSIDGLTEAEDLALFEELYIEEAGKALRVFFGDQRLTWKRENLIRLGRWICDQRQQKYMEGIKGGGADLLEALKHLVKCEDNRAKDLRHREAWLPLKFSEQRMSAARAAIAAAEAKMGGL